MSVEERLSELGLTLPDPPGALAMYRPALRSGPYVFVSGQVAMREGAIVHAGVVGAQQTVETAREATQVASELLRDAFGEEHGVGTRLALGVSSLPLQSPVELALELEVVDG